MAWDDVPVGAWSGRGRARACRARGPGRAGDGRGREDPGSLAAEPGPTGREVTRHRLLSRRASWPCDYYYFFKAFLAATRTEELGGTAMGKAGGRRSGRGRGLGPGDRPARRPRVPGCRRGRAREGGAGRHTAFTFGDAETCRVRGATAGPGQLRPLTAPARQAGSGGPTRSQHGGPQTPHDASVAMRGTGCLPLLETSTK